LMSILPNMHVYVPCDSVETEKATKHALLQLEGPAYLRFAREATPIVTTKETPYQFGRANVIRYRGEKAKFLEAFETVLAHEYTNENEDATIIACGPMVPEAMRAAWILKEDFGIDVRVVNVHTVKPLDAAALVQAAEDTRCIVTAEEHQVGGFGNIVAGAILKHRSAHEHSLLFDMLGVKDRFGLSGKPWELVQAFGLTAEHIADRVKRLVARKCGEAEGMQVHSSILAAVECSRCHTLVPFGEFMCETPMAGEELCADCERRSEEACAECRTEWTLTNPNFNYLCRDCRDIAVQC
jgi:transketolase